MPTSPFTITSGSNTVVLNAERRGEAAFTVANISGRTLRGRGVPQPLGPTAAGWLSIAGQAERDFGIGATQQYVVQVAVPMDAAPGDHTFRLDAVATDNPDENFTQGPVVTFQVAPLPPTPKPFPWWIVGVAAGVIVLVGVAVFLLTRPRVGNFDGTWLTNFAQVNLSQNGSTISGTLHFYGDPDPYPMTGTINGETLTGLLVIELPLPYTLTLVSDRGSFDGFLILERERLRLPWCGVRSGALPAGCGFSGHWNLAGDGQAPDAFADVVQTGPTMSGSFSNGTTNGQVAGLVSSLQVEGQFITPSERAPFHWELVLVDGKIDQFQGNANGRAWCGFRDGSAPPSPCLATLLPTPPSLLSP